MRSIVREIGVQHLPLRTPCLHALTIRVRRLLYVLYVLLQIDSGASRSNVVGHVALADEKKKTLCFRETRSRSGVSPERTVCVD